MKEKNFTNEELGIELKSFIDNKQNVWFRGKDVATILGYKNTDDVIKRHVSENHKRKLLFRQPRKSRGWSMTYFIDEAGFYELVFSSKLEAAKKFRDWVFTTVLPSIRKYGYYKLFKIENETRENQRVLIGGKKYYKHPAFSNYAASKNGVVVNVKTGRIMRMANNGRGYLCFVICDKKLEKPKTYLQHRFVYEVFKGAIPRCLEIDHINNIKTDNRIKNLQLLNHKQNVQKGKNIISIISIISINIETGEEKTYNSITKASVELEISISIISKICKQIRKRKSATSQKNGKEYTFKYLD